MDNASKVIVVVPTPDGNVMPECLGAIGMQTVSCDVMVETLAPEKVSTSPRLNKSHNSTRTRNAAREKLLALSYDYVLWVDSDTVLPTTAIEEFLKQPQFKVQAGWSQIRGSALWSAGKWVADNTLFHFRAVEPSLVRTDYAGLGCLFMHKEILAIPFTPGLDKTCKCEGGETRYLGPCVTFGNSLFERGIPMYMNGSVVCDHLAS